MGEVVEHKHIIIRAELESFFQKDDKLFIQQWFENLVSAMKMNLLSGPHAVYVDTPGLRGWTAAGIIETSHIVIHVWDEPTPVLAQFDVYTCGSMDTTVVVDSLKAFNPSKIDFILLDREFKLEHLGEGSIILGDRN